MKSLLKGLLEQTGYRIIRATARNRFAAQQETLVAIARRGYRPLRIVDGGANVGDFARMARAIFPHAQVDLIEPQPACQPALSSLVNSASGYRLHATAIGREKGSLMMALDPNAVSTGAHVALDPAARPNEVQAVPVDTLDAILAAANVSERIFLKLDLQGWELEALHGALGILSAIEVILIEVSFYPQAYEPPIALVVAFLAAQGFLLYDIASLFARPRDNRPRQADFVFVREGSPLCDDRAWS